VNEFNCFKFLVFSEQKFKTLFSRNFSPNFFNGFEISIKLCVDIIVKKKILGSPKHFLQTWKSNADETARKNENGFCECVIEFNFAAIKGSGLFAFAKNVKIVVP
jgi:hypothetical protein